MYFLHMIKLLSIIVWYFKDKSKQIEKFSSHILTFSGNLFIIKKYSIKASKISAFFYMMQNTNTI